jgi:hypothetical protein
MAVTFTQGEIDAFRTAMLNNPGVLEMDIGDKHYKFESLEAMRLQLAYMERNISSPPAGTTRYGAMSKGLPIPAWNDRNNF